MCSESAIQVSDFMCLKLRRKRRPRAQAPSSPPRPSAGQSPDIELTAPHPPAPSSEVEPQINPGTAVEDAPGIAAPPATDEGPSLDQTSPHPQPGLTWVGTSWNAAKLILDVIKEASDVFPPLKSAAGGLSAAIKHVEQTVENDRAVEKITQRMLEVKESLTSRENVKRDLNEMKRRKVLASKLDKVSEELKSIGTANVAKRFLNNAEDVKTLVDLVEDLKEALLDYQLSLQRDVYFATSALIESDQLDLLDKLPRAKDGGHRFDGRKACLKGTRIDLLDELEDWATSLDTVPIFYLSGAPGTGKTTISQTFADRMFSDGRLGASVFFSRESDDRSNIRLVFTSIAFQLAYSLPEFRVALVDAIKAQPDLAYSRLVDQIEHLLLGPLMEIVNPPSPPLIIVIDALDECVDREPESAILSLLSEYFEGIKFIKFFITSRPEAHIRKIFDRPLKYRTKELVLHDVSRAIVDEDIRIYLKTELMEVTKDSDLSIHGTVWPTDDEIQQMVKKCAGLFIYASTTVGFIRSMLYDPRDRLRSVLDADGHGEVATRIDPLYKEVLKQAYIAVDSTDSVFFDRLRPVVACIILLLEPLSCDNVAQLLSMGATAIIRVLRPLSSVFSIPSSRTEPIRRFHQSFPDFITDAKRCDNPSFYVDPKFHHGNIALNCLLLMKKKLMKRNICQLPRYAANEDVKDLEHRRKEFVGDALEYACRYWTKHLHLSAIEGEITTKLAEALKSFLKHQLLYWIEICSLQRMVRPLVNRLRDVENWASRAKIDDTETSQLLDEGILFMLKYFDIISYSAMHIYHSALPSAPPSSALKTNYRHELLGEVEVIGAVDHWNLGCTRSTMAKLAAHVAFSNDGRLLAVTFRHHLEIFDAVTLDHIAYLYHIDAPRPLRAYGASAAFSADDTLLLSLRYEIEVEFNSVVEVWDVQTGGRIRVISGNWFGYFAFSSEGTQFVLGRARRAPYESTAPSPDPAEMLEIWDADSGQVLRQLVGHGEYVTSVAWSPNGLHILSASEDKTLRLWDSTTGTCLLSISTLEPLCAVAYSTLTPEVASIDQFRVISIRNSETLGLIKVIRPERIFRFAPPVLSFSPRKTWIISAYKNEFFVWDYREGKLVSQKKMQYSDEIGSCSISPDGSQVAVSGKGVELWRLMDIDATAPLPRGLYRSISLSDTQNIMTAEPISDPGNDITEVWNAVTATHLLTVPYHLPTKIIVSPNRRKMTFAGNGKLHIYTTRGKPITTTIEIPAAVASQGLSYSPDGRMIMSVVLTGQGMGPTHGYVLLWDAETGDLIAEADFPIERLCFSPTAAFSADGSIIMLRGHTVTDDIQQCKISGVFPGPVTLVPHEEPIETPLRTPDLGISRNRSLQGGASWVLDERDRRTVLYAAAHKKITVPIELKSLDYPEIKVPILEDGILSFLDFSGALPEAEK